MSVLVPGVKRKFDGVDVLATEDRNSVRIDPPEVAQTTHSLGQKRPANPSTTEDHTQQAILFRTSSQSQPLERPVREINSDCGTPPQLEYLSPSSRVFAHRASIVLIGIRGTGKSTLAVILSTATGRRLVDADQYFQQVTGLSRNTFKKEHDAEEYRQQEARVMGLMLAEHKEGCVIACGPGSMEQGGQKLLKSYARTNPVIHIIRDAASIQTHLEAWDRQKINSFLTLSGPLYRACSNLEFFNISESRSDIFCSEGSAQGSSPNIGLQQRYHTSTPFLTLKGVERDFLGFIAFATGSTTDLRRLHAALPLSSLKIESREYTYAVTVSLSALLERNLDIEELASTADAFELKIDLLNLGKSVILSSAFSIEDKISQTVAIIRRNTLVPLIYHVESDSNSKLFSSKSVSSESEDVYLNLVYLGLRLAPDFLTIDLSCGDSTILQIIASKGSTRIIGHFSSDHGSWDGEEYINTYKRAMRLGCDIVRLSKPAVTMEDNFAVLRFRHRISGLPEPHPPVIAFNSGTLGRLSCWSNPVLTPVSHPLIFNGTQERSNPSITVQEAQEALFASFTLDPQKFYVFGGCVTQSLSPAMHQAAYGAYRLPHEYKPYQSSTLRSLDNLVQDPSFGGLSVNLPFKTEIIPLLQSLSPHAHAIGAVNTILPIRTTHEDGKIPHNPDILLERNRAGPVKALHGDNTDWIGIFECIRRGLSPANAVSPSSTGLVIGAGGMARAAIYSMIHLGVQNIFLHNRTLAHAQNLAQHYNTQFDNSSDASRGPRKAKVRVISSTKDPWPSKYKQPTMVVCCIPAHSTGDQPATNFEMPECWLESPTGGVVVEVR
jgi:3-dehydroquinate dehydratase type I